METWLAVVGIFGGYLLGSIPTSYIILRIVSGVDIRTVGTGNVGALNAFQQRGPKVGVTVLVADVSKGVVAVFLPQWIGAADWGFYGSAVSVVVGHNWPVFLHFRGGKGAAAILGVGLALAPILTLISIVPVVVLALTIRNVVVGAATGFVLFNILTLVTGKPWPLTLVCLGLTLGVIGNYLSQTINQTLTAIRHRRWRGVFFPD